LRLVVFFLAVVVLRRVEVEREVPDVERALEVPDADREREVPDADRDREVPEVERLAVPDVERDFVVVERDRLVGDVVRFFAAVEVERDLDVPDVERAREVPDADRDRVVPDVERDRVAAEVRFFAVVDFAAALPPLLPAAFFCAVAPRFVEVVRLEAVLDFARLGVARGEAARTREISSSVVPSTGASSTSSKGGSYGFSVSK
jgi:hypothetical protein